MSQRSFDSSTLVKYTYLNSSTPQQLYLLQIKSTISHLLNQQYSLYFLFSALSALLLLPLHSPRRMSWLSISPNILLLSFSPCEASLKAIFFPPFSHLPFPSTISLVFFAHAAPLFSSPSLLVS